MTARDESQSIGTTVRLLLAQRYPGLEVIVVDDRSSDGTGEILDRLQAGSTTAPPGRPGSPIPRLTVLHVRELPRGWLGKCHACHVGSARARGDWILFMDGDVELAADDLLARVVALASRRDLDHVAIVPDQRPMSVMQTALLAGFAHMYLIGARVYETHLDLPRGGGGIGAFNLVKRSAYERIGGHGLLRMDPTDDFKLGRLLKESGARQRFFDGLGMVRCRWHRGVLNVARGLEKNLFAGFDYSLLELAAFTIAALGLLFGPSITGVLGTAMAVSGGRPGPAYLACLPFAAQALVVWGALRFQTRRYGGSPAVLSLLYPAAGVLLIAAAWNSALRTLVRGGVRWRDTFYALEELRAGRVRAGAGRRLSGA
ncbi:MAG: hypothetical protein AUH92_05790 [Acidobacteria bacterium 13_1_40CM_4_69_4]|nr:MAG: hypothetical protein AUH92_05790 [Acidobacteria bacterium 13_1_40CM_4_69_4]